MIRLHNLNCMEAMEAAPDDFWDLAIVDPPYGIGMDKNPWFQLHMKPNKTWKTRKPKGYKKGNWDSKTPPKKYFDELIRVSKNQIIWGGNYFADKIPPSGGWIVWDKKVFMPTMSKAELGWTNCNNHIEIVSLMWSGYRKCEETNRIHPTQKPIALYEWLLSKYAKKGFSILDTHLGSGSSAIAAHRMGFEFDGYEIDRDYFQGAQNRLREEQKQLLLFGSR